MLPEKTFAYLNTLTYRDDAKRFISILPLGSICWEDESVALSIFPPLPEPEQMEILRVFSIRMKIWDGETLTDDDRDFWETVHSHATKWAIFRRLELSRDEQRQREEIERNCAKEFGEFLASADEVSVSEERGVQRFSATFHVKEGEGEGEGGAPESQPARWSARLKRFITGK